MGLIGRDDFLNGGFGSADNIDYDNSSSGLTSTDVQSAIDELAASGGGGTSLVVKDIDASDNNYTPNNTIGAIRCDTSLGNVIINLPDASGFVRSEELIIYHNNGTNNVVINTHVGDTFGNSYTHITMDEVADYCILRAMNDNRWIVQGLTLNFS